MSSTIGTSIIVHTLHTFCKKQYILLCLRLVIHQRICIFPAETLLMLMMLALCSRGFEAISFTVIPFLKNFMLFLMFFDEAT